MRGKTLLARAALIFTVAFGLIAGSARLSAQGPAEVSGAEILRRIDQNEVKDTEVAKMKMTVSRGNRKAKELTMQMWIAGRDRAAMEVLSGPDKGTRYLQLGDDLWIASREADKPMKISGHMLRQSMLDSDWSYEDTTNNKPLADRFTAAVSGVEVVDGRTCVKLELKAIKQDETYPAQTLWVDQKTMLPIRQELKALSGMLLKTVQYQDLQKIGARWVPMKITIKDALKKDSSTLAEFSDVKFGERIDPKILSLEFVENIH